MTPGQEPPLSASSDRPVARPPLNPVIRNILYNLLGQGVVLVLSFVAVRFIFRRLGADAYGLISFNLLLTTLVSAAAELGISSTTVREVSSFSVTEPAYIRDLIRTASLLYWTLWATLAITIYLSAPLLVTHWVNLTTLTPAEAVGPLRVLSIAALTALPRTLYTSLFRGRQRMEFNNGIDVGTSVVQQAGVVAILAAHGSFQSVAFWIAASMLIGVAAYIVIAGRLFGWAPLVPGFSPEVVKRNLGFSAHMMSISVLAMVQTQTDKLLVSRLLPISQLGLYSFLYTLGARASFVSAAVSQAALPSLSGLHRSGDESGLTSQYRKLQDLVCFGTLPVFAAIPFFALPLLGYLFNDQIAQSLLLPTAFLSLGFYMNATITMPYTTSLAVGRPRIAVQLNLVALLVVTPVTAALVYLFGIPGAAFSWIFYHLFAYAYAVPRWCSQCLHQSSRTWYVHVCRAFALGALAYGLPWLLAALLDYRTIVPLAVLFLAASIAYSAAAYRLLAPPSQEAVRHRLVSVRRLARLAAR